MLKRLNPIVPNLRFVEGESFFPPKVGKDGFYYDRKLKTAWCELQGKAWSVPYQAFLDDLDTSNHRQLSLKERDAVSYLVKMGNCPYSLRKQLLDDFRYQENRIKNLEMQKHFLQSLTKVLGEAEAQMRFYNMYRKRCLPLP